MTTTYISLSNFISEELLAQKMEGHQLAKPLTKCYLRGAYMSLGTSAGHYFINIEIDVTGEGFSGTIAKKFTSTNSPLWDSYRASGEDSRYSMDEIADHISDAIADDRIADAINDLIAEFETTEEDNE